MRKYGIYLAYQPNVDLSKEGLGRHLAMFLKGAAAIEDVHFSIACPSWTVESLERLFEAESVPHNVFQIVSPQGKPYLLKIFELIKNFSKKPKKRRKILFRIKRKLNIANDYIYTQITDSIISVNSLSTLLFFILKIVLLIVIKLLLVVLQVPFRLLSWMRKVLAVLDRKLTTALKKMGVDFYQILMLPQNQSWVLHLFEKMHNQEVLRLQEKITTLNKEVRAWYCPTSFWPEINDIKSPSLICVPDVVLSDFPVGFAEVNDDRALMTFNKVKQTIYGGNYFVTYSESVKWETLVNQFSVLEQNITVIPHAPNSLETVVKVESGVLDAGLVEDSFCKDLLGACLKRNEYSYYASLFKNRNVKFLFYASQFRPSKNVFTLLRAFKFLLRRRYIGHKLILTGNISAPESKKIREFIEKNRLKGDVFFLSGLNLRELTSFYKLSDLAVNPTLSEGGCPFTFTESLSVGTPVVMSDIPVAREVLSDPNLQEATFFDPYDWRDCAKKIEWAINNKEELLQLQLKTYNVLNRRNWTHVVQEHIDVMDKIADSEQ